MPLPDKDALLRWIRENPTHASKRDIARAFDLKGADRIELKRLLRELTEAGAIDRSARRFRPPGHLPPATVLVGDRIDRDGDLLARPLQWSEPGAPPPILYIPRKGDAALGPGDRFLAKLAPIHEEDGLRYEARLIRKLQAGAPRALGVIRLSDGGGRVVPVDKRGEEMRVEHHDLCGAEEGELVEVEALGPARLGLRRVRVVERLGDPFGPRAVSLIAIHQHQIPTAFPADALAEAEAAQPASLAGRLDLRETPLLTIDPPDARDHDDAVAALPDDAPDNPGGWRVWVAIADVAHYVRPGSALDRAARERGNSCYFPDRVVPMLPERLSGDLCSLHEGEDRPVLALQMRLSADGRKLDHAFHRAVMRSAASLTYAQAQEIADGADHALAAPVRDLFAAYACAAQERTRRAPLALDLPERRIVLDEMGHVTSVAFRERFEAHRLIEEFMVLANVCAAETLEAARRPLIYRVHEEPAAEKLDALREQVETVGLTLAKGQVLRTSHFNALLEAAEGTEFAELVNMGVLRAQTQAYYSPENFGHFGLHLRAYAHFTSPIRRYADLVVHRALIAAHRWGADGQTLEEAAGLAQTAEHISRTERRAMEAERDTTDRYLAAFLAEREGAEFDAKVSGVARFGLFVKLDETGADGIVPISTLGREYWRFDAETLTLTGETSGKVIGMGARARVRLVEAAPVSGGLRFELLDVEGAGRIPSGGRGRGGAGPRRKLGATRAAALKAGRKGKRTR
ncbi:MAG: ribonuclease R [Rubrimonas sp.]|uniref:ribonuclease R n=1 Tax=Rubrimonas sp. TaxID=2036015 RepID=UPI002FDE58B5